MTIQLNDELPYWLALNRLRFIHSQHLEKLKTEFGSLSAIFRAQSDSLKKIVHLNDHQIHKLKTFDFSLVEPDLKWLSKKTHQIITLQDPEYPNLLREIDSPPLLLYIKGKANLLSLPQIAIVGSRKPTPIGKENAYNFAMAMVESGFVVTSGLASGIDSASHNGALQKGCTIAVLGTGVDQIYPQEHARLAESIVENGALISELPLGTPPKRENFPLRNRIISGLSLGVLVVEAAIRSGSLISARYAREQGREVFAIPGSIHNPESKGCHWLIKQGAVLTENLEDIITELPSLLGWLKKELIETTKEKIALSNEDKAILACVDESPTSFDQILIRSGGARQKIIASLINLELNDLVVATDRGYMRTLISKQHHQLGKK